MDRTLSNQYLNQLYDDLSRANQTTLATLKNEEIGTKKEKLITKSLVIINNLLTNIRKLQIIKKDIDDI